MRASTPRTSLPTPQKRRPPWLLPGRERQGLVLAWVGRSEGLTKPLSKREFWPLRLRTAHTAHRNAR